MSRFAAGKRAIAECDVCGFRYKLHALKDVYVKGRNTNLKACTNCWDEDHPQLRLGETPINDPQAVRDPRPDSAGYAQSRAVIVPVTRVTGTTFVRTVTVVTS